jgi:protein PhnA
MSKGQQDRHHHRLGTLNQFGKDLVRRSKGACELCGASHVHHAIYEVEPLSEPPRFDRCILICETCKDQLDHPRRMQPEHWHFLAAAVWSDIPAVQVTAVRTLRLLQREDWARDLLDQVYLAPEIEAWVGGQPTEPDPPPA